MLDLVIKTTNRRRETMQRSRFEVLTAVSAKKRKAGNRNNIML